jgi:hypothetical protein
MMCVLHPIQINKERIFSPLEEGKPPVHILERFTNSVVIFCVLLLYIAVFYQLENLSTVTVGTNPNKQTPTNKFDHFCITSIWKFLFLEWH